RGDETMTMLEGYARIREFFANFNWWKTEPHDELVTNGSMCLAEPGKLYAVYLPHGGETVLTLPGGKYASRQFDPLDGKWNALPGISGTEWKSPVVAGARDAAFL